MGKHDKCSMNIFNLKDINIYYGIPSCYTNYSKGYGNPYEDGSYHHIFAKDFQEKKKTLCH